MRHRRRNRTALRQGTLSRESDCASGRLRRGHAGALLPAVPPGPTGPGPVDGPALADELARLVAPGRRGGCV